MHETAHPLRDLFEQLKPLGDVISWGALLGYIAQVLPTMATALTVIWMVIRIYETPTVQRLVHRKQAGGEGAAND